MTASPPDTTPQHTNLRDAGRSPVSNGARLRLRVEIGKLARRDRILDVMTPIVVLACVGAIVVLVKLLFVSSRGEFVELPSLPLAFALLVGTVAGLGALVAVTRLVNPKVRMSANRSKVDPNEANVIDERTEVRDLDRSERMLARIEPVVVTTYATVAAALFYAPFGLVIPDFSRLPAWYHSLGFLAITLAAVYALDRMRRAWAVGLSLVPLFVLAKVLFWLLLIKSMIGFGMGEQLMAGLQSPRQLRIWLTALITLVVFYTFWRGWIAIARLRPDDRELLRSPHALYPTRRLAWLRYLGIPPVVAFIERSRATVIALFALAAVLLGAGIAMMIEQLTWRGYSGERSAAEFECRNAGWSAQDAWRCANDLLDARVAEFYILCAVVVLLLLMANGLQRLARRRVRLSATSLLATDLRSPILFLRSFRDDQVALHFSPRRTWLSRLLALWLPRQPLDHVLLDEGTPLGPVVALGSPQDKFPPYGVARGYFEHKNWQEAVQDLARDAQVIVLCVDDTEGVWWEVKHIGEAKHDDKTLFLFHPSAADPKEHARIAPRLLDELGKRGEVPRVLADALRDRFANRSVLGFYRDTGGALQIGLSSTFSNLAYVLLVRAFLRDRAASLPKAT